MRSRRYKRGDRVKINIHKSVSPEMLAWLNKQSNPTNFSLYIEPTSLLKIEVNPFKNIPLEVNKSTESTKKKSWDSVDQLDCPFF